MNSHPKVYMTSMLKSMNHNPQLAKTLRYLHVDHLRTLIAEGEHHQSVPNSMVILHYSTRGGGQKDFNSTLTTLDVSDKIEGKTGEEMNIAFLHVIDTLRSGKSIIDFDSENTGIIEARITAISLIHGIHSKDGEVNYGEEKKANGTMVNTTFVDGSVVVFMVDKDQKINFAATTHDIPVNHLKMSPAMIDDQTLEEIFQATGLSSQESLMEKIHDEQYFAEATLSVLSTTKEEFDEIWGVSK